MTELNAPTVTATESARPVRARLNRPDAMLKRALASRTRQRSPDRYEATAKAE
jgi:hypothetical protein